MFVALLGLVRVVWKRDLIPILKDLPRQSPAPPHLAALDRESKAYEWMWRGTWKEYDVVNLEFKLTRPQVTTPASGCLTKLPAQTAISLCGTVWWEGGRRGGNGQGATRAIRNSNVSITGAFFGQEFSYFDIFRGGSAES